MTRRNAAISFGLAMLATVLCSVNLRTGIASLAPVLGQVRDALGISTSAAGVFTALPGFAFALMGLSAVPLARRMGLSAVLLAGGVAITAGLALRVFTPSFWPFLLLTILVVGGIAVANVLLPAWIKYHATTRTLVPLMSAYTALLGLSMAIGPLSVLIFTGDNAWRPSLAVWAIPAAAYAVVWTVVALRAGRDTPRNQDSALEAAAQVQGPIYSSPTAVAMMAFFGLQSAAAYVMMGWMPQILVDGGVGQAVSSLVLTLVGLLGVLGGVVLPVVVSRIKNLVPLTVTLALFVAAGWLGILLGPAAAPLLWGLLLGIGGLSFPLALTLLAARTRSPLTTARLSGFVQPFGYLIAGVIPLLMGVVYSATGEWTVGLIVMIALALTQALCGIRAGRSVFIDDELTRT